MKSNYVFRCIIDEYSQTQELVSGLYISKDEKKKAVFFIQLFIQQKAYHHLIFLNKNLVILILLIGCMMVFFNLFIVCKYLFETKVCYA